MRRIVRTRSNNFLNMTKHIPARTDTYCDLRRVYSRCTNVKLYTVVEHKVTLETSHCDALYRYKPNVPYQSSLQMPDARVNH